MQVSFVYHQSLVTKSIEQTENSITLIGFVWWSWHRHWKCIAQKHIEPVCMDWEEKFCCEWATERKEDESRGKKRKSMRPRQPFRHKDDASASFFSNRKRINKKSASFYCMEMTRFPYSCSLSLSVSVCLVFFSLEHCNFNVICCSKPHNDTISTFICGKWCNSITKYCYYIVYSSSYLHFTRWDSRSHSATALRCVLLQWMCSDGIANDVRRHSFRDRDVKEKNLLFLRLPV